MVVETHMPRSKAFIVGNKGADNLGGCFILGKYAEQE